MKSWRLFIGFMAIMLYAGCNGEIIEPESVDADYNITYYSKPPHSKESQGYLIAKGNEENQFINLIANEEPSYSLMIIVSNKKGQEALDFIKEKEDSPIKSINDLNPSQTGMPKSYLVETTKYFQSRNFFVSETYRLEDSSSFNINVLPYITVKMNTGQDIETLEEKYKGNIKLVQDNEDGTFLFSCSMKTSYEVLMLTIDIFTMIEVAWAEASMTGPKPPTNK